MPRPSFRVQNREPGLSLRIEAPWGNGSQLSGFRSRTIFTVDIQQNVYRRERMNRPDRSAAAAD